MNKINNSYVDEEGKEPVLLDPFDPKKFLLPLGFDLDKYNNQNAKENDNSCTPISEKRSLGYK